MKAREALGVAHGLFRNGLGLGDVGFGDRHMRARRRGGFARDDDLVRDGGGIDGEELRLAGGDLVAEIDADLGKRPRNARRDRGGLDGLQRTLDRHGALEGRVRHGQRPHRQRDIGQGADRLSITFSATRERSENRN